MNKLLQQSPNIWRAGEIGVSATSGISTGFKALDEVLPSKGWPLNALTEIICPLTGIGEMQLLMPVLASLSQKSSNIAWVAPPFEPYAPHLLMNRIALEQVLIFPKSQVQDAGLWVMEKVLRSHACGVAMSWPAKVDDKSMRRLQLAAEAGKSLGFVFREFEAKSSPAALRIRLTAEDKGLCIEIIKARGGGRFQRVYLDLSVKD